MKIKEKTYNENGDLVLIVNDDLKLTSVSETYFENEDTECETIFYAAFDAVDDNGTNYQVRYNIPYLDLDNLSVYDDLDYGFPEFITNLDNGRIIFKGNYFDIMLFVTASEYAKKNNLTYVTVIKRVERGYYKTARKIDGRWYISKIEPNRDYNTFDKSVAFFPSNENFISLTEYAEKKNLNPATVRRKAAKGLYKTAKKIGRNWLIDENEPNVDNRYK